MKGASERRSTPSAGASGAVVIALLMLGVSVAIDAQGRPPTIESIDVSRLAGIWYEVATTGTWWHRRCVADARYGFDLPEPNGLRATSVCTTRNGTATYRGRLRAPATGDGRLAIRFTPAIVNWLPATWSDFWILQAGPDEQWLLIGDNRRERLLMLSRTVVVDEAAMALAIAAGRQRGYDTARLERVPHPSGATGLLPSR